MCIKEKRGFSDVGKSIRILHINEIRFFYRSAKAFVVKETLRSKY